MPFFGLGKSKDRDSKAVRESTIDARESKFSSPRESKRTTDSSSPRESVRSGSISEEPSSVEKLKRRISNQGVGKATANEIGMPTNVKHVQHMGYSEDGGFKFDDEPIPIEWKKLFRAAGVKKKDLEDKATAKMIVDTITANMTPEELAKLPPLPGVTERVEAAQARRDVLTLALTLTLTLILAPNPNPGGGGVGAARRASPANPNPNPNPNPNQARRDVQAQRAEQAKLMLMMLDQKGSQGTADMQAAMFFAGKTADAPGAGPPPPPPGPPARTASMQAEEVTGTIKGGLTKALSWVVGRGGPVETAAEAKAKAARAAATVAAEALTLTLTLTLT